jgi:hypothetical protein
MAKTYLEIVPVIPEKYCRQFGGPPRNSDPQAYWVTCLIDMNKFSLHLVAILLFKLVNSKATLTQTIYVFVFCIVKQAKITILMAQPTDMPMKASKNAEKATKVILTRPELIK